MEQSIKITYEESLKKIIFTFPIYYKIFEKYYSKGTDVSGDLNRIYQSIFSGLMEYYSEFMLTGIDVIISGISSKYNPDKPYAIIDYIEFLFGNILYETFLTEIKKINPNTIRYEHLCVFEYIIRVELVKYRLYLETISKIESESKLIIAMENRVGNCIKKISFSLGELEKNYSTHENIIELCKNLISESGFDIKSKIDTKILDSIDSFMKINSYKTK
jgi:hypothetical protein